MLSARIRELVEDGLARKGVSARKASMDVVGHDGLIRDIRAGRVPSFDRVATLFEYLAIPFEFGPQPGAQPGLAEPGATTDTQRLDRREALRAGYLPFPWHRSSTERGNGPVAFAANWLAEQALDPEHLCFIAPQSVLCGPAGALALIDQFAPRRGGPALWCYQERGTFVMARLHWQGDGMLIISGDAPGIPPRALVGGGSAHLSPLGRVVWLGAIVEPALS